MKFALCGYVELQTKLALGSLLSFERFQGKAKKFSLWSETNTLGSREAEY